MSIQDESFPHDEFFSESDYSFNNGSRYQFPNARRQQQQQLQLQQQQQQEQLQEQQQLHQQQQQRQLQLQQSELECHELTCANVFSVAAAADAADTETIKPEGNISTSSSTSNEENLSPESANGRPSSVLSGKTTVSEPTNFGDETKTSSTTANEELLLGKANSCQNIHSKYTKRRYQHVQSKVGQYIAQMKAEDEKRRNTIKFQRHRSLPETLSAGANQQHQQQQQSMQQQNINNNHNTKNRNDKQYSSMELHMHKMDETISDAEANLSEILTNTPATTISGSSSSSASMQQHECSDDVGQTVNVDFIDKLTYAQLVNEKEQIQSYSDYLQARLNEKMCENMRLKRNVDYLRIELSNCQDKLKRQSTYHNQSGMSANNMRGLSLSSSSNAVHSLGRQTCSQTKSTKATQTELPVPSLPSAMATPMKLSVLMAHDIFSTPENPTTDVHNTAFESLAAENDNAADNIINVGNSITTTDAGVVKFNKSIATIQPIPLNNSNMADQSSHDNSRFNVLRQRLNSSQKQAQQQQQQQQQQAPSMVANEQISGSSDSAIDIESTELLLSKRQRQRQRNGTGAAVEVDVSEFVNFNGHTDRYTTMELGAATSPAIMLSTLHYNDRQLDYNMNSSTSTDVTNRYSAGGNKKHKSARKRWFRFFAPCTRCKDLNESTLMDSGAVISEQSQTQIPLLEKSIE